ncbi:unnamed protein product [Parajaminaea phylloscopi]
MLYVGRGKTFVGRVVCGHLANLAVPGRSQINLHYTLAKDCNEVVYYPAVSWAPASDIIAMNTAEWLVCTLLGTYQLSKEEVQARGNYGLPALPRGIKGANASACVERPSENGAEGDVQGEDNDSGDKDLRRLRWEVTRVCRVWATCVAMWRLAPSPKARAAAEQWSKVVNKSKKQYMARVEQLLSLGKLELRIKDE